MSRNRNIADLASQSLVKGQDVEDIVALTQAEYDAITPSETTLYVVTD